MNIRTPRLYYGVTVSGAGKLYVMNGRASEFQALQLAKAEAVRSKGKVLGVVRTVDKGGAWTRGKEIYRLYLEEQSSKTTTPPH